MWRAQAFGIEVHGDFAAPGLPPGGRCDGPSTVVEVVDEEEIAGRWPGGGRRLLEEHFDDGPDAARSIDHVPGAGYRLYARGFGVALVAEDGSRVWCAPPRDEPWSWQRFLVGRILPWTAVLLGRESFHAAAIVTGGRAVALSGASGAGKSSLVAELLRGGATFLTDDVLVVDDGLRAHPGAGILSLRHGAVDEPSGLGTVLGDSGGKLYLEVPREPDPHPLGALCFLAPGAPGDAAVEPIDPDPRLLLGSTFNESLQSPQRLEHQFELCADLADRVPFLRVSVAGDLDAARLAEAVLRHVDRL